MKEHDVLPAMPFASGAVVDEALLAQRERPLIEQLTEVQRMRDVPVQGTVTRCFGCDTDLAIGIDLIVEGPGGEAYCPPCALSKAREIQAAAVNAGAGISRAARRRILNSARLRGDGRTKGTRMKKKPSKKTKPKKGY